MADTIFKTDDLDGSPAAETITFSIAGKNYELDLSAENAATFKEVLAPWVAAARPSKRNGIARTRASRDRSKAIRAFAQARGLDIAERGRIPAHVIRQFENQIRAA
jgi:hypothetical protein